jgi:hypothetical protein
VAGKVDATEETALKERMNVDGFPTLMFTRDGKTWKEYKLGRELNSFVEFANRITRPPVTLLRTAAELRSFAKTASITFLLCDAQGSQSVLSAFTEAAARNQHALVSYLPGLCYRGVPKFWTYGSVCFACAQRPGLPRLERRRRKR